MRVNCDGASLDRPDHRLGQRYDQRMHHEIELPGRDVEMHVDLVAAELHARDVNADWRIVNR